jgi:hypothetical protein
MNYCGPYKIITIFYLYGFFVTIEAVCVLCDVRTYSLYVMYWLYLFRELIDPRFVSKHTNILCGEIQRFVMFQQVVCAVIAEV